MFKHHNRYLWYACVVVERGSLSKPREGLIIFRLSEVLTLRVMLSERRLAEMGQDSTGKRSLFGGFGVERV